jgi:hypothetical protein
MSPLKKSETSKVSRTRKSLVKKKVKRVFIEGLQIQNFQIGTKLG